MKLVLNIQKKHLFFLIIILLIIGVGVVLGAYSDWLAAGNPPSHDILWTSSIRSRASSGLINVVDDLVLERGLTLGGVKRTSWPAAGVAAGDCIEVTGGTPVPSEYKHTLSSIQTSTYQPAETNKCIDKCTGTIQDCSQYPLGTISWVSQPLIITGIQCIQNCRTSDIICPTGKNAQADVYNVLYTLAEWELYCK